MTSIVFSEGAEQPSGLIEAFWSYENALMSNDFEVLDQLFAPHALRGDAAGVLLGHEEISAFRSGRGGAPARTIDSVFAHVVNADAAVLVAITTPRTGGHGQQTQLWKRLAGSWKVDVAHVSTPAPAIAAATWRVAGSPLVAGAPTGASTGASTGALAGETVAVKDLFSVAGYSVGAGIPAYLAESPRSLVTAPVVTALLEAGASVQGISQTDEFAYSIAGKNGHYGTPPNGAVVGAIPGGSSSGSSSAVATGQVSIGLGTDTGGSIRVPASYQGLWGLRTTHGSLSTEGLLGLAPSFDTVGWLTRSPALLRSVARATFTSAAGLGTTAGLAGGFAISDQVTARASDGVQDAFDTAISTLIDSGTLGNLATVELPDIDDLHEIFRTMQSAEAWATHGEWVEAHPGALSPEVEARFRFGQSISADTFAFAQQALALARIRIESVLGDRVLLLPSASSIAPSMVADAASLETVRQSTLRLTCIAGIAGRPALSIPALSVGRAPVGLGIVGPLGSDLALIDLGAALAEELLG